MCNCKCGKIQQWKNMIIIGTMIQLWEQADKLGKDGWEPVGITLIAYDPSGNSSFVMLLKRPYAEGSAP